MATGTRDAHLPALGEHRRNETGAELQATIGRTRRPAADRQQLHWNIFGRPFKPLHEHLDELVDTWRDLSDSAVAEHAVQLGDAPDGRRREMG